MKRQGLRLAGAAFALALAGAGAASAADDPAWTQPQAPFRIVGNIY